MASSQPLRKLRILCLHGYMQVRRLWLWLWLPSRLTMPIESPERAHIQQQDRSLTKIIEEGC